MFVFSAHQLFIPEDHMDICPDSRYFNLFRSFANENTDIRLAALREFFDLENAGVIPPAEKKGGNFCSPSWYSFSPFSPAIIAYIAHRKGARAEICDLNCTAGAKELSQACGILGIPFGINAVYKANLKNTPFYGIEANCEEPSCLYVAALDIDAANSEELDAKIQLLRKNTLTRLAAETWALRSLLHDKKIMPDFWNDIMDHSMHGQNEGRSGHKGSVSEQHIFYILAKNIIMETADTIAYAKKILADTPDGELSFINKKERHAILRLAELLDKKLRHHITYSSFEDSELKPDTLQFNTLLSEISGYANTLAYPLTENDETADNEEFFGFLKRSGIEYAAADGKKYPKAEAAAKRAGMSVITKSLLPKYVPVI